MKALSLPMSNTNSKLLHITDCHLFADESATLLGVNSCQSFTAVTDAIFDKNEQYDLIVATGDFAQDGSAAAYQRFAEKMIQFNVPCVWLAGNHDNYIIMHEMFNTHSLPDNKLILLGEKWIIILLNSQVVNHAYGFLSPSELDFLQKAIIDYPDRFALIFLHHHPILSGCKWLDEHALKNRDIFERVIKQLHSVKGIGWGHIHQNQERMWHHVTTFSTPSTCFQFKSQCHDFALSNEDYPGWREIDLLPDGKIATTVHRIASSTFSADLSLCGY